MPGLAVDDQHDHVRVEQIDDGGERTRDFRVKVFEHPRLERANAGLTFPEYTGQPPKRIESFDISHIQGTDKVASMVVWEDGAMKKADYRKFIIRGPAPPDVSASSAPSAVKWDPAPQRAPMSFSPATWSLATAPNTTRLYIHKV